MRGDARLSFMLRKKRVSVSQIESERQSPARGQSPASRHEREQALLDCFATEETQARLLPCLTPHCLHLVFSLLTRGTYLVVGEHTPRIDRTAYLKRETFVDAERPPCTLPPRRLISAGPRGKSRKPAGLGVVVFDAPPSELRIYFSQFSIDR